TDEQRDAVADYKRAAANQDLVTRKVTKEKTGVFTGSFAVNPATQQPIPIWIADYVLMEYGTGAIMAGPGPRERDFEFATVFNLPSVRVVAPKGSHQNGPLSEPFTDTERAVLVHSGQFNGLPVEESKARIIAWLESNGHARGFVNYRL